MWQEKWSYKFGNGTGFHPQHRPKPGLDLLPQTEKCIFRQTTQLNIS